MAEPQHRHLRAILDRGVLVLTITETEIQGEEIATELRQEMLEAIKDPALKSVVVNFEHTQYISSAAFWPLLSLHRKLQERGGRLTVCGLNQVVGDVFYSTRLISPSGSFAAPFGVETDVASAVASLDRTPPPA
jgi:anti-anti-sigma factor